MIKKLAMACVVTACATGAQAATLDFLGMANSAATGGEQAVEFAPTINPILNAFVPIATTAMGYNGNSGDALGDLDGSNAFGYLDGNSAGMGVCSSGINAVSRDCVVSSDDNLQQGEVLGLSWATGMAIETLFFRGENHPNDSFGGSDSFDVSFDSGASWSTFGLINAKIGGVAVNGFVAAGNSMLLATSATGNNQQFYLSAAEVQPVPLPAAGLLLVGGLGGLAAIRRRRKAAA